MPRRPAAATDARPADRPAYRGYLVSVTEGPWTFTAQELTAAELPAARARLAAAVAEARAAHPELAPRVDTVPGGAPVDVPDVWDGGARRAVPTPAPRRLGFVAGRT